LGLNIWVLFKKALKLAFSELIAAGLAAVEYYSEIFKLNIG